MSIAGPTRGERPDLASLVLFQETDQSPRDFFDPEREIEREKKTELVKYCSDEVDNRLSHFKNRGSRQILSQGLASELVNLEIILPGVYQKKCETDNRMEYAKAGVESGRFPSNGKIDWLHSPDYLSLIRFIDPEKVDNYQSELDLPRVGEEIGDIYTMGGNENMDRVVSYLRNFRIAFPKVDIFSGIDFLKDLPWEEIKSETLESLESSSGTEFFDQLEGLASLRVVQSGDDRDFVFDGDLLNKAREELRTLRGHDWYIAATANLKIVTASEVKITDQGLELTIPSPESFGKESDGRPERLKTN